MAFLTVLGISCSFRSRKILWPRALISRTMSGPFGVEKLHADFDKGLFLPVNWSKKCKRFLCGWQNRRR